MSTAYEMVDNGGTRPRKSMHVEERLLGDLKQATTMDVFDGLHEVTTWSRIKPWLIMMVLIAVIIFQIVIVKFPIWLADDTLSNTDKTVYTTGITILATLVSATTAGQIRSMWITRFRDVKKTQVLLQIGSSKDQLRFYWLSIPLIIFSLITASITGATTIGRQERTYAWSSPITIEEPPNGTQCFNKTSSPTGLTWQYNDAYIFPLDGPGCPSNLMTSVRNLVQLFGFGYQLAPNRWQRLCHTSIGGEVACSAIGAPLSLQLDCNLFYSLDCRQPASACAPVFKRNPVSCHPVLGDLPEDCKPISNGTTSLGFCPHALGDMSFVMTTRDQNDGSVLWTAVGANESTLIEYPEMWNGDPDFTNHTLTTYCTFSLNDTIEFNIVTNSSILRTDTDIRTPALNGTGQTCDAGMSVDYLLGSTGRVSAAYMVYHLLNDAFLDGLNDLISDHYGFTYFVFPNSNNTLEDYIGVHIATGMAYYWGDIGYDRYYTSVPMNYTSFADKIGSGRSTNILYILPLVFGLGTIAWLMITDKR